MSPGVQEIPEPVPVGAIIPFKSATPYQDAAGRIVTYAWSGASDYNPYFSTAANGVAPTSQSSPQPPDTAAPTYSFIVGATAKSYTITLDVNYASDGSGAATITFTSVRPPAASLAVQRLGTQSFQPNIVELSPGIQISFTATVDDYTQGQFMFMQIVVSTFRQYTDLSGQNWYLQNSSAFPGFDGPLLDTVSQPAYSYSIYAPPGKGSEVYAFSSLPLPDAYGNLSLPAPRMANPYLEDDPGYEGAEGLLDEKVSASDSFSTYLMYQPSVQGVWIALSEIDGSWSEIATMNHAGSWTGTTTQQPQPQGPTRPASGSEFPGWVNLGGNLGNQKEIKGP